MITYLVVPGFNEYVQDLHRTARSDYVAWRDAGNKDLVFFVTI